MARNVPIRAKIVNKWSIMARDVSKPRREQDQILET